MQDLKRHQENDGLVRAARAHHFLHKIKIYYTKQTNNANTISKFETFLKIQKKEIQVLFCYMYNFNNSYFVNFVNCVIWVCWGLFIYFIYIIYTRVGHLHV